MAAPVVAAVETSLPDVPSSQLASPEDEGSAPPCWRLSVVNPTSLLNKESSLLALGSHVYLLSETSAVAQAQSIVARRLRPTGLSWVWGTPVPEHRHENAQKSSLRGHAAGVALASVFPLRLPFAPLVSPAAQAHRLALGHIRLGPLHARLVVLYGWPANHAAAAQRNEQLFREALLLIAASNMPTLVGGDFNIDVRTLPVWSDLVRAGYVELFEFHRQRFGQLLPPTCRNSTRHDTVLLPQVFQQLLVAASVDTECHLFDSHAPLTLTFHLPQQNPCQPVWRKPDSWMHLEPDAGRTNAHYSLSRQGLADQLRTCSSREDLESAFLAWASDVEAAVDGALRDAHLSDPLRYPIKALPRRSKGRCVYREVKSRPFPTAAPGARPGDYRPPEEALSFRSRAKVKQVRRLQAFSRRLRKHRLHQTAPPRAASGSFCEPSDAAGGLHLPASEVFALRHEWCAISQAKGYPPSFPQWLLQVAHFEVFYDVALPLANPAVGATTALDTLPPADWLEDVLAYVRYECEAVICQENQARRQLHRFSVQLDSASNLRAGYKSVRPHDKPAFTAIPVREEQLAELHCCAADGWGLYRVPAPDFLRPNNSATADNFEAEIGTVQEDEIFGPRVWVKIPEHPYLPRFKLCQDTDAATRVSFSAASLISGIQFGIVTPGQLARSSIPGLRLLTPCRRALLQLLAWSYPWMICISGDSSCGD